MAKTKQKQYCNNSVKTFFFSGTLFFFFNEQYLEKEMATHSCVLAWETP